MPTADFTIDGLVIRVVPSGDNDRLVTVLTKDRGRLSFMAKGARSLKSKYMPACNPYVWGNYEIHSKGTALWLRDASVTEGFTGIGKDIASMYLAQYFCDVCMELSEPEEEAADLLRLVLNCFYALSQNLKSKQLIKAVFELRAAAMSGYEPDLGVCRQCGKTSAFVFDIMNGGMLCTACAEAAPSLSPDAPKWAVATDRFMTRSLLVSLTPSALDAARYILSSPVQKMLSFELTADKDLNSLSKAAECYLLSHLERGFPTLKTYYEVLR